MNVLNKSFIYFLITIHTFSKNTNNNIYSINDKCYSTQICNQLFWNALLRILNTDGNSISLTTFVDQYPDIKEDIEKLYKLISEDSIIYFYDLNKFLFNLKSDDYTKLMRYLENDGLNTPSDWSSIGSSDEDLEDVTISFNIDETIHSPIHDVSQEVETKVDAKQTVKIIQEVVTKQKVETILDVQPTINPITEAPKSIRFYDPNIIPKREFKAKRKSYCEYCYEKNSSRYSWYINYLLKCSEWIKVPIWIKKYF